MADNFIELSKHPDSGFFLHDTDSLVQVLAHCQKQATQEFSIFLLILYISI